MQTGSLGKAVLTINNERRAKRVKQSKPHIYGRERAKSDNTEGKKWSIYIIKHRIFTGINFFEN